MRQAIVRCFSIASRRPVHKSNIANNHGTREVVPAHQGRCECVRFHPRYHHPEGSRRADKSANPNGMSKRGRTLVHLVKAVRAKKRWDREGEDNKGGREGLGLGREGVG